MVICLLAFKWITQTVRPLGVYREVHVHIMPWNIDYMLCDIIGCYGYDVNIVAAVAQAANDKDGSSAIGASMYLCT